ncbi:MAG: hypothetical protein JST11_12090 [Acidobacteria bacterium]|nr:hypothetical protein [Acidobacteriota bacterium]
MINLSNFIRSQAAAFLSLFFVSLATGHSSTIVFSTGPATVGGAPVNVSAQFDFNATAHTVTIRLLNLQNDPAGVTSVLGSVRFTLTNAGSDPTGTVQSSNFATFAIDKNGNPYADSVSTNYWNVSNIGGTTMAFCTVCAAGGNHDLIIGGPAASGVYSSAENGGGSIAGNKAHNPFILGSNASYSSPSVLAGINSAPSWVISLPTITPTVTVTSVIFGFGTGTNYGTGTFAVNSIPEPGPVFSVVGGLALILLGARKRRASRR